jgi:hypothetical protein
MEVARLVIAEALISVDTSAACGVGGIIGVRYRQSLQDSKLRFDQVHPGSFRGHVSDRWVVSRLAWLIALLGFGCWQNGLPLHHGTQAAAKLYGTVGNGT